MPVTGSPAQTIVPSYGVTVLTVGAALAAVAFSPTSYLLAAAMLVVSLLTRLLVRRPA